MGFLEKFSFGANGPFLAQKWHILYNWIHFKDFFEILHNERCQEVHGTYLNCFPEKNLIWDKWAISAGKWHVVITVDSL